MKKLLLAVIAVLLVLAVIGVSNREVGGKKPKPTPTPVVTPTPHIPPPAQPF